MADATWVGGRIHGTPPAATCSTSRARRSRQPKLDGHGEIDADVGEIARRHACFHIHQKILTRFISNYCLSKQLFLNSNAFSILSTILLNKKSSRISRLSVVPFALNPLLSNLKWHTHTILDSSGRAPDWWAILTNIAGSSTCRILNYATCSLSVKAALENPFGTSHWRHHPGLPQ